MSRKPNNFVRILICLVKKIYCNEDRVIAVCGPEGSGKSRSIFLRFLETWYETCLKKKVPKGRYGVTIMGFRNSFLSAKKFDFTGMDECGDIMNNQDFRNKFNSGMYKTYTVTREKLLLTVLVMPSFFDFTPGFRKRRIHGLFQVARKIPHSCKKCKEPHSQKVCPYCGSDQIKKGFIIWRYYNRKNLDLIIYRNRYREKPSMNVGAEYIEGKLTEYEGKLIGEYVKLKKDKLIEKTQAFARTMEELDHEENTKKCPNCGSRDFRYLDSKKQYKCRCCPMRWKPDLAEKRRIKSLGGESDAI